MFDDNLVDSIVHSLADLAPDALELVIDALTDIAAELAQLAHDDIVAIITAAVTSAAGVATKQILDNRRLDLEAAVRQALTAG
jgi:hypothetical protein